MFTFFFARPEFIRIVAFPLRTTAGTHAPSPSFPERIIAAGSSLAQS
jgi:hypothetical protein